MAALLISLFHRKVRPMKQKIVHGKVRPMKQKIVYGKVRLMKQKRSAGIALRRTVPLQQVSPEKDDG